MAEPLDLFGHPLGRLLRLVQQADPQQIVETLAVTVAELGGSEVVLYLIDYDHSQLTPVSGGLQRGQNPETLTLEGTMAGRVFQSGAPLAAEREDGWQVWVLVAERAQKLGVLAMTLPAWNDSVEEFCVELGMVAGHVVRTANAYTDRLLEPTAAQADVLGSRDPMECAAAVDVHLGRHHRRRIRWNPLYQVGGDSFDYSFNGDILDIAMFDAMGHGLHSASLGVMAMSAYRNTRREHAAGRPVCS